MTVKEYLSIKEVLMYTTRRLYRGKWQALHNGKWISEDKFRAMYKLPTVLNGCHENPDKTKSYLL
jgi:hypothetical protein